MGCRPIDLRLSSLFSFESIEFFCFHPLHKFDLFILMNTRIFEIWDWRYLFHFCPCLSYRLSYSSLSFSENWTECFLCIKLGSSVKLFGQSVMKCGLPAFTSSFLFNWIYVATESTNLFSFLSNFFLFVPCGVESQQVQLTTTTPLMFCLYSWFKTP